MRQSEKGEHLVCRLFLSNGKVQEIYEKMVPEFLFFRDVYSIHFITTVYVYNCLEWG